MLKGLTIEKMDDAGTGLARIAQLSSVDSMGDTYEKGAFSWMQGGGQWVQMLPAHDRRAMPLGKAFVYEDGDQALAKLYLNLDTQAGKDWYSTLKFDLAQGNPVQEWSYGYEILDADFQVRGDQRVQVLKKLKVDEISPVIRGAGVGTGTLAIKSAELKEAHYAPLIAALGDLADSLPAERTAISATGLKQLETIGEAIGRVIAGAKNATTCSSCGAQLPPDQVGDQYCAACADAAEGKERLAIDTATAGYLKLQARRHLAGRERSGAI